MAQRFSETRLCPDPARCHDRAMDELITRDTLHGSGGTRLSWRDLPPRVRDEIQHRLGAGVAEESMKSGGFSPGMASVLRLTDGSQVFVKAVSSEQNPDSPGLYRKEAAIAAGLPETVPAPRLQWSYDDGRWVVLVFEAIDGSPPDLPWRGTDRDRVLAATIQLSESMTPAPRTVQARPFAEVFADAFSGWRTLVDNPDARLSTIDPWARRHLTQLAEWETRWPGAAAGDTLLHCDLRADNILLTPEHVMFVDWPAAATGAAWMDVLLMLPSMALQGAGDPDSIVETHPLTRSVDPNDVTAVLVGLAGYFISRSLAPPPPGLPTVRDFQRAQGRECLAWLRRRRL